MLEGAYVFLASLTLITFILTRNVEIRLEKAEVFCLEIHFPVFAVCLTASDGGKEKKRRPPISLLPSVLSRARRLLSHSEVTVGRLVLPGGGEPELSGLRYYRFMWIVSAMLVYIETETQKLNIQDNGFILNSDSRSFEFDITLKATLIRLIIEVAGVGCDYLKFKVRIFWRTVCRRIK